MSLSEQLKSARDRLGLTLREVAESSGIGLSSLSEFETGKREPSLKQMQVLADIYRQSISYFFQTTAASRDLILWRERPQQSVALRIEADFARLCEQYHNLERWCNDRVPTKLPTCDFQGSSDEFASKDAEALAHYVRIKLQLGDRPGQSLLRVLEEVCGVKIFHIEFEPSGTAACTVNESFGASVLLNAKNFRWRRNFDLAHELFHLLTWKVFRNDSDTSAEQAPDREEALANLFARSLLMPLEATRLAITNTIHNDAVSLPDLFDIARQFDVSIEALIYRTGAIFSLDKATVQGAILACKEMEEMLEKRKRNIQQPQSRPERFCALAITCLNQGHLSAGRFAEYMGISRMEAQSYVAQNACNDEKIAIPAV